MEFIYLCMTPEFIAVFLTPDIKESKEGKETFTVDLPTQTINHKSNSIWVAQVLNLCCIGETVPYVKEGERQ